MIFTGVFSMGATRGEPICCGGGAVLHFNLHNYVTFKEGFGEGTNNFAELSALRLLLTKALD